MQALLILIIAQRGALQPNIGEILNIKILHVDLKIKYPRNLFYI